MRDSRTDPARLRAPKLLASAFAVACVSLTLAACGSSGNSGGSGSSGSTGSAGGSGNSSQTTPQASSNATLKTIKVSGYGTALATAKGAPVYILTSDPNGGSKCTGACAKDWPPLTVTGKATGADGVDASMISTFRRSDGTTQVIYNGHALYTRPGLSATAAAGTAANGGIWYLIAPSGKPITKTSGSGY
jgi:predicted lipoprotein with Yx(FWY)xxD motif